MDPHPLLDAHCLDPPPLDAVAYTDLAAADWAGTWTPRDHASSSWSGWSWTHCMIARSASRSNAATLIVPFGRVHRWTAASSASLPSSPLMTRDARQKRAMVRADQSC